MDFNLNLAISNQVKQLEGPIVIFGAGGFIGANLFKIIVAQRSDVVAITSKPFIPWRLNDADPKQIIQCDITDRQQCENLFTTYNFKTVFDFAAYGAYSKQANINQTYNTNIMGLLNLLEVSGQYAIKAFVHAGSSSEYGLNAKGPLEHEPLEPNSHYAITKASAAGMVKYYGTMQDMPIVNLRYYSIYGPYEEPDRLIPMLIKKAMQGEYPPLVQPEISRDFVFVNDAIYATLLAATQIKKVQSLSLNIASNTKTTIAEIAQLIKQIFNLNTNPSWGNMPNRKWDLKEWYGNAALANNLLGWQNHTNLQQGLEQTYSWQKSYAAPLYEQKMQQDKVRHKLTAIIACYKDAQAMPIMHKRLEATFKKIQVNYEIIFVNDCSPDNTNEVLENLVQNNNNVIGIEHSRNFGSQSAFLSGMEIATGDAVILLDGDLQDPPELIEEFYEQYKLGYDVVYGKRIKREGSQTLSVFYKLFYRLFRSVAYVPIPLDAGDFSLMDKKVVAQLVKMPETDQFLRGLRAWVGFKQTGVDYVRPERMFGTTTNNWRKNIGWAKKAIFSFSYVPIELLTFIGWGLTFLSLIGIIAQILMYFLLPKNPHGITTIIVLIMFFGGIQILGISILGEYQAKILEETKRRPKFIRKNILKKR
jgi:polyisoprenyl-phosphate glycosyltransferase